MFGFTACPMLCFIHKNRAVPQSCDFALGFVRKNHACYIYVLPFTIAPCFIRKNYAVPQSNFPSPCFIRKNCAKRGGVKRNT
ncbi:MAG: hypothetical protein RR287_08015, partial [Oscillospiraceae bacterium]